MTARGRKKTADVSRITCPNPACSNFGMKGAPSTVSNGTYRTKNGMGQRYKCKTCGQSFCQRTGALFAGMHSAEEEIISGLKLLAKGLPIRKASQLLGLKADTLRAWLARMAEQSEAVNRRLVNERGVTEAELASLWNSVRQGELRQRGILWRKTCGWRQGWDTY